MGVLAKSEPDRLFVIFCICWVTSWMLFFIEFSLSEKSSSSKSSNGAMSLLLFTDMREAIDCISSSLLGKSVYYNTLFKKKRNKKFYRKIQLSAFIKQEVQCGSFYYSVLFIVHKSSTQPK